MDHASVKVQLRGGLGNQLFQYGAGYALARKHSAQLVIDTRLLPSNPVIRGGVAHWPEQISEFDHGAQVLADESSSWRRYVLSRALQLERLFGDSTNLRLNLPGTYASESKRSIKKFESLKGNVFRINSYCGSAQHFLGYDGEISERIRRLNNPSPTYLKISEEADDSLPVGMHIRIGDYANFPHVYGKFDSDYYQKAYDRLRELIGDRPLWIFTDQPDEVRSRLPALYKQASNPPWLQKLSGLETLTVMSKMSGLVCSNSTFSWWASFLSNSSGFRCIFPSPLFALEGPIEPKEFLQPGWLQLARNFDH